MAPENRKVVMKENWSCEICGQEGLLIVADKC